MNDERYMNLALAEARKALARGEFPVGSVFVHEGQVLARGSRSHSCEQMNEVDHAEVLALRAFLDADLAIDPSELTVYATMEPCLMCFSTLILNGIRRIVYAYEDVMGGGTGLDLSQLNPLYAAMTIEVVPHVCRMESLTLFQQFFSNPDNAYWPDSFLARYTLAQ
ncbi:MAG: nucleoside deaminase [Desulfobulbaceae bacterium]|uniref:Nucleoside deaminase n=1 Tax=Candidatus Desulfatifera sulfidica TaxID=2841691 RepID=A0A8J6T9S2_9BACT|nr:nucleoside deaminase [Candidatus Desulfatifera sulfidica]